MDSSSTDKQQSNEDEDLFEGTPVINISTSSAPINNKPLSFKRVICHWAASTMQKKSHLTYLLELLKEHRPPLDYDALPSSGQQLMYIDGRDVPYLSSTTEQDPPR
jgi:hypothetical protein